jgi:hypothetical protein
MGDRQELTQSVFENKILGQELKRQHNSLKETLKLARSKNLEYNVKQDRYSGQFYLKLKEITKRKMAIQKRNAELDGLKQTLDIESSGEENPDESHSEYDVPSFAGRKRARKYKRKYEEQLIANDTMVRKIEDSE